MATPITFLDRLGFTSHYYHTPQGASLFSADRFDVRLITPVEKLPLATGDSLRSVLGVRSFDHATLRDAADFQNNVGGVKSQRLVVLTERLLLPAARLRDDLDVAGDRPDDVLPFRDKILMKEFLASRGIRVPRFAAYSTGAALELLREFDSLVIKPRQGAGAQDVHFVKNPADIDDFEARFRGNLDDFEVEEYIEGQLYHIDSVVQDSRVIAATAGRSLHAPTVFASQKHYWDIEVAPGELLDRLLTFNQQVISCHPGFTGVTHHEAFVTADDIVFCEIAARWGGGGIRPGFRFRTGIDLISAMLAAQVGEQVAPEARWSDEIVGYTMVYLPGKTLRQEVVLEEPWVVEKYMRVAPGGTAPRPRSWEQAAAVLTVSGRDEGQVSDRLAAAEEKVVSCFE